jgi:triacylglycerol lipase
MRLTRSFSWLSILALSAACEGGISGEGLTAGEGASLVCNPNVHPIILHHGFSGGDGVSAAGYFNGVADHLRNQGEIVFEAAVAPFQSSEFRGAQLSGIVEDVLAETNACKVNIIAHSQGGLDARHMISSLGYGNSVSALVTISTPHRGTALADLALGFTNGLTEPLINSILDWLKVDDTEAANNPDIGEALFTLSEAHAPTFNAENPDDPRVQYYSIAGRSLFATANSACAGGLWGNNSSVDSPDLQLSVSGTFLLGSILPWRMKANDGVVTVASARWGIFLGCVPADHSDETNKFGGFGDKSSGFDALGMYDRIVDLFHSQGF